MRTRGFVTGFSAAVLASIAAACGTHEDSASPAGIDPVDVRVASAVVQPFTRTFEAGGVIKASTTAQLSARIAAELRELKVQPGDRVAKGQVLAVLDDRDLAARRAQAHASLAAARNGAVSAEAARQSAEAALELARASHRRVDELRQKNSATPQEMDRAAADLRMAEATVRAAGARQAEASSAVTAAEAATRAADVTASFSAITAPFDGLVTSKLMEPGNMVSPGLPVLTVETGDAFRLEVQVDEARARYLQVGGMARVQLDRGEVAGRIVEVARAMDPMGHAFLAKIQLPADAPVRSGMFARARFEADDHQALVVPAASVVRRGQLSLVFIVDGSGRARMRAISAGSRGGEWIEILAGVQAGERVLLDPPPALVDGTPLRITGRQS
jgi:multidrug efflux pump subunit AcrA (membrane-fusion protein)